MTKKTPDELADQVLAHYGNGGIGADFANVLDGLVKAGGYEKPGKITAVKRQVVQIIKELNSSRRAS